MSPSKRLEPVAKVAQGREQDALHSLAECQRVLDERRARLAQLIAYRDEYARGFQAAGATGLSAARLHEYHVFLDRLGQAVEQQQVLVRASERECLASQQRWLELRSRARAIDEVVSRYREREQSEAERREQRESDERAQRQGGRGES